MIDHFSFGTQRYTAAVAFYGEVLAPLGLALQRDTGAEAAFGTPERWFFFLYPAQAGHGVNGDRTHIAWHAPSRAIVEAVHAQALRNGAADIFMPRVRPDITETYFGAMFTDLDGHRIEVKTDAA